MAKPGNKALFKCESIHVTWQTDDAIMYNTETMYNYYNMQKLKHDKHNTPQHNNSTWDQNDQNLPGKAGSDHERYQT
jgi:hypothetical protein